MVLQDVSRPMEEQGGHGHRSQRRPRPADAFRAANRTGPARRRGHLETLFPDGQNGRIPIVAVRPAPRPRQFRPSRRAHLLRESRLTVGLACSAGTFVGDRRLATRGPAGSRARPSCFSIRWSKRGCSKFRPPPSTTEAWRFDDCDVAVIEPLAAMPELQSDEVHELDAWRRVVVESVSPQGTLVLAADDPDARGWRRLSRSGVVLSTFRTHIRRSNGTEPQGAQPSSAATRRSGVRLGDREVKLAGCSGCDPTAGLGRVGGRRCRLVLRGTDRDPRKRAGHTGLFDGRAVLGGRRSGRRRGRLFRAAPRGLSRSECTHRGGRSLRATRS